MKSFGADFKTLDSGNVRVLVMRRVTQIEIDEMERPSVTWR